MRITTHASQQAMKHSVEVAPGLAIPQLVTVHAEDCNGYDVEVDVAPSNGRLVATQVRISQRPGGPAVTGEALRSIPVATLTKPAADKVMAYRVMDGYTEMSPRVLTPEIVANIRESGPTLATLEWVTYIYRMALLMGDPPTKTVETSLGLPRSTAGRWVGLARQEDGLLSEAGGPGKAGV